MRLPLSFSEPLQITVGVLRCRRLSRKGIPPGRSSFLYERCPPPQGLCSAGPDVGSHILHSHKSFLDQWRRRYAAFPTRQATTIYLWFISLKVSKELAILKMTYCKAAVRSTNHRPNLAEKSGSVRSKKQVFFLTMDDHSITITHMARKLSFGSRCAFNTS